MAQLSYTLMKIASGEQELYLEGLFKAEIVKNRTADAGYDAECRRYTVFKFIYLPKSLRPLKIDVTEVSRV